MVNDNSVAERVAKLASGLIEKGLTEKVLEVIRIFSEVNNKVDRELPITAYDSLILLYGNNPNIEDREKYRAELYRERLQHYEQFLSQK